MTISRLLAPGARLEKVASGFTWLEGPAWIPARGVLRVSDIPGNRVVEFSEAAGGVTEVSADAEFTNGRTLGRDGSVIECSHGRRAVQIDRAASEPGAAYAPEVLVDRFGEVRLNSPNDVVEKSDGTIWFTDPSYGIKKPEEGHAGEEEYGDRYVFRLDPADGSLTPVVIDVEAPNGLAFSPDESVLYVSDSSLSPADEQNRRRDAPRAFDPRLRRGRGPSREERPRAGRGQSRPARRLPRGQRGNLWSSSLSGIQVFTPAGEKLGEIPVPEKVANCTFGGADGSTLYICASTSIYRIRTRARDAAADRWPGAR